MTTVGHDFLYMLNPELVHGHTIIRWDPAKQKLVR